MRNAFVEYLASWVRRGVDHWRQEGAVTTVRELPAAVGQVKRDLRSLRMDSSSVQETWEHRDGEYSPEYYAIIGPNVVSEAVVETVSERFTPDNDPSVLELGCSSGRHLEALRREGYHDLAGVDINPRAKEVMGKVYPDLTERIELHVAAIEDAVPAFDDGSFDVVYAVETLELVAPDSEWIFRDIARITGDTLVVVASGHGQTDDRRPAEGREEYPFYYREYGDVFEDAGLHLVDRRRIEDAGLSMWVFER